RERVACADRHPVIFDFKFESGGNQGRRLLDHLYAPHRMMGLSAVENQAMVSLAFRPFSLASMARERGLQPCDEVRCPHCHLWHRVDQPYVHDSTAAKTQLYATCRGQQYYAGASIRRSAWGAHVGVGTDDVTAATISRGAPLVVHVPIPTRIKNK